MQILIFEGQDNLGFGEGGWDSQTGLIASANSPGGG